MVGCAAFGCANRSEKGFLMRKFPKEPGRRKAWCVQVGREGWVPTDNSALCDAHFEESMWEKTREDGTRKLKCNAIPTIFAFACIKKTRNPSPSLTGEMESGVAVKPEYVWLLEDNEVLTDLQTEVVSIISTSVMEESVMQDVLSSQPGIEENVSHCCSYIKEEISESSEDLVEKCSKIKSEIGIEEHNILEDSSEFILSCNESEYPRQECRTTGKIELATYIEDIVESEEEASRAGNNHPHCTENGSMCFSNVCDHPFRIHSDIGDKCFQCEICSKYFIQSCHLKDHMRTHTGDKPFQCDICSKYFSYSGDLRKHMWTHAKDKPFKCGMCSKCFKHSDHVARHMRCHTGKKNFQCNMCRMYFTQSSHLAEHMRIHTGEKPFRCDVCCKCFTYSSCLVKHLITHAKEKPRKEYTNSITVFANPDLYSRTHAKNNPFKCVVCGTCFARSDHLARHARTHAGHKQFQCGICNKYFTQSGHLAQHMRIHTGDKPFKCNICNKCFSYSGDLTKHIRTHTGDKPYKCEHCSKCYSDSSNLKSHQRRAHT